MNYTKNKTDSQEMEKLSSIVHINPRLIFDVEIDKQEVWIMENSKMKILNFEKDEFIIAKNLIVDEIKSRPDQYDRVDDWETKDQRGMYSQKNYSMLLHARKTPTKKRFFQAREKLKAVPTAESSREEKVNEFLEYVGADKKWCEMYLAELAADTSLANEEKRTIARRYGLI